MMFYMKILFLSDTHGDDSVIRKIHRLHPDMDRYIHGGDSESLPSLISPFVSVLGNRDHCHDFKKVIVMDTPLGKLMVEHIPDTSIEDLKRDNIKFYLHGHTHLKRYEIIDDIYFLNPGSLTRPFDGFVGYIILDITSDKVDVKFMEL